MPSPTGRRTIGTRNFRSNPTGFPHLKTDVKKMYETNPTVSWIKYVKFADPQSRDKTKPKSA